MRDLRPWLRLMFRKPVRLGVGGLLGFATQASAIALPALSAWLITKSALAGQLLTAGTAVTLDLYAAGGAIGTLAVACPLFRYGERICNHDSGLRQLTDVRVTAFRGLSRGIGIHRNEFTQATWLSRLAQDVRNISALYLELILPTVLAVALILSAILLTALVVDGKTALAAGLVLVLALLVATLGLLARTARLAANWSHEHDALRTGVIEHIEGFAELTAAGRIGKHAAMLMRQARRLAAQQARVDCRTGWHLAATRLLIRLSAVFVLWSGFTLFKAGALSGPALVGIAVALLGLGGVIARLPGAFGKLGATNESATRLNRASQGLTAVAHSNVDELPRDTALLAKDITIKHHGCAPLLNHFDVQVGAGERVGILGSPGCGKSSLADVFAGLQPPAHGFLLSQPRIYLTQYSQLFANTLRANLLLGRPSATDAELWRMLEAMELAEGFAAKPEGLDTWLGNTGSQLSGGEARRVALARVLLHPAPLVILDEPFTGLDEDLRRRIAKRLELCLAGKTVISLARGPDALPATDRVIQLGP